MRELTRVLFSFLDKLGTTPGRGKHVKFGDLVLRHVQPPRPQDDGRCSGV